MDNENNENNNDLAELPAKDQTDIREILSKDDPLDPVESIFGYNNIVIIKVLEALRTAGYPNRDIENIGRILEEDSRRNYPDGQVYNKMIYKYERKVNNFKSRFLESIIYQDRHEQKNFLPLVETVECFYPVLHTNYK